jgi:hypothetical protein
MNGRYPYEGNIIKVSSYEKEIVRMRDVFMILKTGNIPDLGSVFPICREESHLWDRSPKNANHRSHKWGKMSLPGMWRKIPYLGDNNIVSSHREK